MKKRKLLAAVMAMTIAGTTLLSGCGMNTGATLVNINNGEDSISLGYGNFVARYTQSLYDATYMQYMGTSMWTKEQDGTTFQDSVKKLVMKSLKEDYLLEQHAADYDVTLSDDEKESIKKAAKAFMKNNDEDTLEEMTATEEIVEQYLTNQTIASKVSNVIKESADITVTKEDAAQRTITYAYIGSVTYKDASGKTGYYTDDQKKDLKAKAEALTKATDLKTEGEAAGATIKTTSYGKDDTTLNEAVIKAADKLSEGEISPVVEVGNDGYYVIRLDSAYDEEAKEKVIPTLEEKKRDEYLKSVLKGWKKEITWTTDKKEWEKVQFDTFFEKVSEADTTE